MADESWPPEPDIPKRNAATPVIKRGWRRHLQWLLDPQTEPKTFWSVIVWWESRRFTYNAILGIVGIPAFLIFLGAMSLPGILKPGEDAVEPMALLAMPILANVGYCGGAFLENALLLLGRRSAGIGPALMYTGLAISLLAVGLPFLVGLLFAITAIARHL